MRILPIILIGVLLWGCGSDECMDNKNSLPKAGFYAADSMASTSTPTPIGIDSISIFAVGVPGDSMLCDLARNLSETYLPFNIDKDSTQYVFRYLQKNLSKLHIEDTITFRYSMEPLFVGAACGVIYKYTIDSIAHTSFCIDSVSCPTGEITNKPVTNINIFFKVLSNE